MLKKKLRKIIAVTLLITTLIGGGGVGLKNYIQHSNTTKVEYKMDMTEVKIKSVLQTAKIQSLQIEFQTTTKDTRYDKTKYDWLNSISKFLSTRELIIENSYRAIFSYDLDRAVLNESKGIYTITMNENDIECVLESKDINTKEKMSCIGRYYNAETTAKIIEEINLQAKDKINNKENRVKALENAKDDLMRLFEKVGIDNNKINIELINNNN